MTAHDDAIREIYDPAGGHLAAEVIQRLSDDHDAKCIAAFIEAHGFEPPPHANMARIRIDYAPKITLRTLPALARA